MNMDEIKQDVKDDVQAVEVKCSEVRVLVEKWFTEHFSNNAIAGATAFRNELHAAKEKLVALLEHK